MRVDCLSHYSKNMHMSGIFVPDIHNHSQRLPRLFALAVHCCLFLSLDRQPRSDQKFRQHLTLAQKNDQSSANGSFSTMGSTPVRTISHRMKASYSFGDPLEGNTDRTQRHASSAESGSLAPASASASQPQTDNQTQTLIQSFLRLDPIPQEWDNTGRASDPIHPMPHPPKPTQIHQLLAPWRSLPLRQAAASLWKHRYDEAIWLRTHYPSASGDDATFAAWRAVDADNDPDVDDEGLKTAWTCLDDPSLFAFGADWRRVFDVLPELAGPVQGYVRCGFEVEERFGPLRARLREVRGGAAEREAEAEAGAVGMALQVLAVDSFLVVADAEAWDTGLLWLLYLDARGNVVRHSRIAPDDVMYTRHEWIGKKFRDGRWWLNAKGRGGQGMEPGGVLGDMYTARGEMGKILYGFE